MKDSQLKQAPAGMKNRPFYQKLGFAINGLSYAIRHEANMRRHVLIGSVTILVFAVVQVAYIWWALISICIGLIIASELINSALEALIDHIHPEYHSNIGHVKDMLAAMVLILSISALSVGGLALLDTL
ncbi:MAG: diacylglycerol kinase [Paraglaciecola polaris]|uniref:diacylglycerol kinase n=1 Tax=Paraglaciecola polaris TaxID=222814 RepID=UPI003002C3F7|tara:strand:+ start:5883 stop:6269 length:387 start_codon:yes stop_codon:yes gene_type:complete